MKTIATLITIGLAFFSTAQLPADSWIYGTWVNQGYAFEGSFYPANSWNAEQLILNEDYSLQKRTGKIEEHQLKTEVVNGKWSYSAESKKLRLYSDNERYSPQGKIIVFDKEYDVNFTSGNYFTVKEKRGDYVVTIRFQREGTTESFETSEKRELERLADLALKYDPNSAVFYMVNSLNPAKRKPMYFDDMRFNFSHSVYNENPGIESKISDFSGTIVDFTDSTIVVNVDDESIRTTYASGTETTIANDYTFNANGFVKREFKLKDLDNAYSAEIKLGMIAPITFSVSAITALLVAPLISINYKTGDFNKNLYYKTAGIGLIGVGASIPLALIFSRDKPIRFIPLGEDVGKNNWYLEKAPR